MNAVRIVVLPDNGRMPFDPEGSEELLGAFANLPIPMPTNAMAWADPNTGKPLVIWCDDVRIRPADFATVLTAIEQYNRDLHNGGVPVLPPAVLEAIVRDELDDDDDDRPPPPKDYLHGFGRP